MVSFVSPSFTSWPGVSQVGWSGAAAESQGNTGVAHGERQTALAHVNLPSVQRSLFKGNTLSAFTGLKQVAERQHREVQMVK